MTRSPAALSATSTDLRTSNVASIRPIPLPGRRTWRPVDSLHRPSDYAQGALALSYSLPAGTSAHPEATALVVLPHGTTQGRHDDMEAWAAAFVQAVVEVIASDRPVTQLVRWTNRRVYTEIAERQRRVAQHRTPAASRTTRHHVATVRVCRPGPDCAEVAARVTFGPRSRAVAARLDYRGDRWMCTAIDFG
jgi:uncharacterized protein DUF6459